MPGVFADQHRGTSPWRLERTNPVAAFNEALLVEHAVRGQVVLAVYVPDNGRSVREADRDVRDAVVECIAPPFVETHDHIHRHGGATLFGTRHAVRVVEVVRKRAGRDGQLSHAPLHEVAGERCLRKLNHLRSGFQLCRLRAQTTEAGQVSRDVPLARGELTDREGQGANRFCRHTPS